MPHFNEHDQEVFHFYTRYIILLFLLTKSFKTVEELLHLLTLHPKLISWSAIKKAVIAAEGRSYQTQDFTKIFPSSLVLTLFILFFTFIWSKHVQMHLEQSEVSKVQPLMHPKLHLKLHSKLCIFCCFSETLVKICRKSWWSCLFSWNR